MLCAITTVGQVGFGIASPSPSAIIEMSSVNKGFLIPRIPLSNLTGSSQISSPKNSMLIFNPLNSGTIVPGYYYYKNATNTWINIIDVVSTWNVYGNPVVNNTHYIGTSDDQDLIFKRNNIQAGLLNVSKTNTAFGVGAITSPALSGTMNTSIGYLSLFNNTTGQINIANGYQSLFRNTIGANNIGIGNQTLYNSTSGSSNIALGYQSLYANINADQNIALGFFALYNNRGALNIAIGTQSLYYNVQGVNNVSAGFQSLLNNTNGNNNVGIGVNSLFGNISGFNNVGMGTRTLNINTTGQLNTVLGYGAFSKQVAGNQNVSLGAYSSDSTINTINHSIAVGFRTAIIIDNQLNIGNMLFGIALNGTINGPTGSIGIGTISPKSNLHINGSIATNIREVSNGIIADDDYTVLIRGNISIPAANLGNRGRVYYILNDTNIPYQITGLLKEKGVDVNNYSLDLTPGFTAIKIQSNGSRWQIITKY